MALPPGSLVCIDYGERPRVAHVRIILDVVDPPDYVVLTPDFDVFVEMIDEDGNEDIAHLWHAVIPMAIYPVQYQVGMFMASLP